MVVGTETTTLVVLTPEEALTLAKTTPVNVEAKDAVVFTPFSPVPVIVIVCPLTPGFEIEEIVGVVIVLPSKLLAPPHPRRLIAPSTAANRTRTGRRMG